MRIGRHHHGGFDEVAFGLVVASANNELNVLAALGVVDEGHGLVERTLVNDCGDEVGGVAGAAHFKALDVFDELGLDGGPKAGWHIGTRGRRTFLTLELKGATAQRSRNFEGVGRGVSQNKILSARFAHNARVGLVAVDVCADLLPEVLEYAR